MKKAVVFALAVVAAPSVFAATETNKKVNNVHCNSLNDCYVSLEAASNSANPSCYLSFIKIGNTSTSDKTQFQTRYSTFLAAKMSGEKVTIDYTNSNGVCTLQTFILGPSL